MKKIICIIVSVYLTLPIVAQTTNNIRLFVCASEQPEDVPESSMDYLLNNLCTAITTDGLAAQSDYMTQFLLVPKINIVTKNILSNTQQQVVLTLDVSLRVIDNGSGTLYASKTINIKGVGTNETKAYNSAFRTINKNNQQIVGLVNSAKKKILDFYETESENIIKKANMLATQENYEEAFYLLSMIPSQCSKYESSISAGFSVWEKYRDRSCSENLAKAQSAWVAGQDYEAANMAGRYLANIFPDASCYGDAQELYREIKAKIGDLWKFEMRQYDTKVSLERAKIEAIQAIGVAYGKGQQPNVILHRTRR